MDELLTAADYCAVRVNLRFNVTMKNAVSVHVFDGFQKLVHIIFYSSFRQVIWAAFDSLVQVHFHDLKH